MRPYNLNDSSNNFRQQGLLGERVKELSMPFDWRGNKRHFGPEGDRGTVGAGYSSKSGLQPGEAGDYTAMW